MKANRIARARADEAGAEVVGALILFGVFVTTIAILNVTAVPNGGRASEQDHYERTLAGLNALQSEAETAGLPGNTGSTVARSIDLAPPRSVGQDFFSYFLATPARASGELSFEPDYGNVYVAHEKDTDADGIADDPRPLNDIGEAGARFPLGRITFDAHPIFREPGLVQLENAGIIATEGGAASMRFAPPISVTVDPTTQVTNVSIRVRALTGDSFSIGGIAPVRAVLTTQAATLTSPVEPNAANALMQITTEHGAAWQRFFRDASGALTEGSEYTVLLEEDVEGELDRVTWTVEGKSAAGNDLRLSTGLAVYGVGIS